MPNLRAYKDPVVVFGTVAADGVSMVVNRRPPDGVTYQATPRRQSASADGGR